MSVESATTYDTQLQWFKSTYSSSDINSDCVEVAADGGTVHVRDSKDVTRPHFAVGRDGWTRFVGFATES